MCSTRRNSRTISFTEPPTAVMSDNNYLLSSTGQCPSCEIKAETKDIIQCLSCENYFHAVCEQSGKASAICVPSFFPIYRRAKSGFNWLCDVCLTKFEANKVATANEKIDALDQKVDGLTNLMQNVINLVTAKPDANLDAFKEKLSADINSKITEGFADMKLSFQEEVTKLKSSENNGPSDAPVGSTAWGNRDKVKEIRTSLLIKRDAASGRPVDVDKLEKSAIDHGIPVNSIVVSESGDTFVNLPDKASSDRLQPLIRNAEPTNEIISLKSKLPTVSLLGVTRENTKTEIINMILKQNDTIRALQENGSHVSVLYTRAPAEDKPYHQVVLRVSPDIRRAISNLGNRIHMGRLVHKVVDRFYVRRCNICQCYGHYEDRCPTPTSPICGYCSETSHISKDCPKKGGLKATYNCNNCKKRDFASSGHSTFWYNCPAYKEQQKKLESSIDYDYNSQVN